MTPSTDWQESVSPDENARFERHAAWLREAQRKRAAAGKADRALHAKGQAGFTAELAVPPDVPEHARVGPFAAPGTFRAYVRYSNGSGERQADRRPDVRGIAVKVLGVDGKKLIPGMEDARTWDLLAIQSPSTPFRDADEFVGLLRAMATPALALPRLIALFGPVRAFRVIGKLTAGIKRPVTSLAASRYWSALPIRWGAYAAHYALVPHATPPATPANPSADHLTDELVERVAREPVTYDLRAQFYVDADRTPIEDASVEWLESDAPFVTVARLTLPVQDARTPRGRKVAELVEGLSFDPWHAPVEFRPLGNMMRARNVAYRESTRERGARPEPDGTERFE